MRKKFDISCTIGVTMEFSQESWGSLPPQGYITKPVKLAERGDKNMSSTIRAKMELRQ